MPVEFIGGLFPRNQLAPRAGFGSNIDLEFLRQLAQAHEQADFDSVLVLSGGEGLQLTHFVAHHTERLRFMIPHRPAVISPVEAARSFASLDHITNGRIRLHAITGISPEPQNGDTLVDKAERYARTSEYLDIVRRTWTADEPFDYEGRYFNVKGAFSAIKPLQQPYVPVSLGGSSDAAYPVAARHTDLYALWAEPLADVAEQIRKLRTAADAIGVPAPRVSMSVRLIIAATEELAWEKARNIVATLEKNHQPRASRVQGVGTQRLLAAASRNERHDRALFMGTATAIGASNDSTSLVGTPDTIVQALLDYYDIGVTTFLNRGYDPLHDAVDYGRWIIPAVREEVRRRERLAAKSA